MKFKENILGLAVTAVVTTFSASAISNEIPAPDAFVGVDPTALAGTETAFNGKKEYTKVNAARTNVTRTAGDLETALTNQAAKNKEIADAQAAIAAANALAAGQLIGGQTKAEIVAAQNTALGLGADGVPNGSGFLSEISGLDTAVITATKDAADAAAVLAGIETGAISNQLSAAAGYKADASAQGRRNGTVASGSAEDTLGKLLFDADAALGTPAVSGGATATGLYADVVTADAALVAAKAQAAIDSAAGTDNYTGATGYVANATDGVKAKSTFTIADTNVLDLRDGDTQLTFTVGTTAANNEAALIEAINAEGGFSFTAAGNGLGTITLTYNDEATAIEAYTDWSDAKKAEREAVLKINNSDVPVTPSGGTTYVAQNLITYDENVANKELLAAEAAAALQVGIASKQLAQANYDAGLATKAAYLEAETAAYTAAATAYTQVDSLLQEKLAQQNVVVAGYEATAVKAETAAAEDLGEVTSTAAALELATAAETAADADVVAAQAAYDATGGKTPENLAALTAAIKAKTAATTAKTAAATAATAAANAYYGFSNTADTAINLQSGTNKKAVELRADVVKAQKVADGFSAQRALQSQFTANATNPAAVLQAALIAQEDTGGALVTAVNTNYQATEVNAAGIATNSDNISANTGKISANTLGIQKNADNIQTNANDILTNAKRITTNETGIAANKTDIATNATGIEANAGKIADLSSSFADNTANLQRVEMQLNADVDMLKSGIASTLAIAGMPTVSGEGMGFSVGTGYYDGESAIAMGLTYVEGNRSYKLSLGNSGGETSASAGAAFKF